MSVNQPLRVLIVDDEAPARSRVRDLLLDCALKLPLEIAGEAENGRRALELLPTVRGRCRAARYPHAGNRRARGCAAHAAAG
jgi:hypothetical protein